MEIIKDGGGRGYSAKVSSQGLLNTVAVTHSVFAHNSHEGKAYALSSGQVTVTATGGHVLWMRNDSNVTDIHVEKVIVGWNGGTASSNKALYGSFWFATGEPSANQTAKDAGVLDRTYATTPEITSYIWDEVGNGMTVAGGSAGLSNVLSQGSTNTNLDGGLIFGKDDTFSIFLQGEEIGEAVVNILFYTTESEGIH